LQKSCAEAERAQEAERLEIKWQKEYVQEEKKRVGMTQGDQRCR